jgi:hypothetical protein
MVITQISFSDELVLVLLQCFKCGQLEWVDCCESVFYDLICLKLAKRELGVPSGGETPPELAGEDACATMDSVNRLLNMSLTSRVFRQAFNAR